MHDCCISVTALLECFEWTPLQNKFPVSHLLPASIFLSAINLYFVFSYYYAVILTLKAHKLFLYDVNLYVSIGVNSAFKV